MPVLNTLKAQSCYSTVHSPARELRVCSKSDSELERLAAAVLMSYLKPAGSHTGAQEQTAAENAKHYEKMN